MNSLVQSILGAGFRTDAWPRLCPRGPRQEWRGARYRTMSPQSEMVTAV